MIGKLVTFTHWPYHGGALEIGPLCRALRVTPHQIEVTVVRMPDGRVPSGVPYVAGATNRSGKIYIPLETAFEVPDEQVYDKALKAAARMASILANMDERKRRVRQRLTGEIQSILRKPLS